MLNLNLKKVLILVPIICLKNVPMTPMVKYEHEVYFGDVVMKLLMED